MQQFVFVGNRAPVLKKMLEMKLTVTHIYAMQGSYLEKWLQKEKIPYLVLPGKKAFIEEISKLEYDFLISNGCPYILPISQLADGKRKFMNIHPSLLPDLKGRSPINGALLYHRAHGATCHLMDDGIDTGNVISQIEIPIYPTTTLAMLYQMSFLAEGQAFQEAYMRGFKEQKPLYEVKDPIYYSRKLEDMYFDFSMPMEEILQKIRAFGILGQTARFCWRGREYLVLQAEWRTDSFAKEITADKTGGEVLQVSETGILMKCQNGLLCLEGISMDGISVGDQLLCN